MIDDTEKEYQKIIKRHCADDSHGGNFGEDGKWEDFEHFFDIECNTYCSRCGQKIIDSQDLEFNFSIKTL